LLFEAFNGGRHARMKKVLKFGTIVPIDESELDELMKPEPRSPLRTKSIQQALNRTPDVRTEKVARGKALVADPNYPSREQIKKIANLLAANWAPATPPSAKTTLWPEA
jgi:hypothetical protein